MVAKDWEWLQMLTSDKSREESLRMAKHDQKWLKTVKNGYKSLN